MAMTISTEGMDELSAMLAKLGDKAQEVASKALYEGAGVVANAMKKGTGSISTEPFKGKRVYGYRLASPEEKAAVHGKTGIAKFDKNGSEVNTLVGLARDSGYVQLGSRKTPVIEIARSINSGTSFMHKQPVFRKAVSQSKAEAQAAIEAKAEAMFNEIIRNMNG